MPTEWPIPNDPADDWWEELDREDPFAWWLMAIAAAAVVAIRTWL